MMTAWDRGEIALSNTYNLLNSTHQTTSPTVESSLSQLWERASLLHFESFMIPCNLQILIFNNVVVNYKIIPPPNTDDHRFWVTDVHEIRGDNAGDMYCRVFWLYSPIDLPLENSHTMAQENWYMDIIDVLCGHISHPFHRASNEHAQDRTPVQ